jgi:hypothetical protein
MILKPTVLVLGAGASFPYGYPLGEQLVDLIVQLTAPQGALRSVFSDPNIEPFHTRLRESEVASIDDFLASNPAFVELGKKSIAAALTAWGPRKGHKPNPGSHWYRYLWRRLYEGALTSEQFRQNRLCIITYNYDRSFQRYFIRVLANAYPDLASQDSQGLAAFLEETIPVVHLHGTMGSADDQVQTADDRSPFRSLDFFTRAAECIRIVHDDEPSSEYRLAHLWLRKAEVMHLLGFGFHATNVRRLNLVKQSAQRGGWLRYGGTAYGMKKAEVERALAALQLGAGYLVGEECLEYLRSYAFLE